MRLLFVAARFPLPLRSGDSKVCFHRIVSASERHDVTFVCLAERKGYTPEHTELLKQYCDLHVVTKGRAQRGVDLITRSLIAGESLQLAWFHSTALRRKIQSLHSERPFDLAHIFMLRARPSVEDLAIPILLDLNDSQTLAVGHRKARAKGFIHAALSVEHRRIRALEQTVGGPKERIVVLSDSDQFQFRTGAAEVVPMGVDLPKVLPARSERPLVVFSGNMAYYSNVDAAILFISNIWPSVRAARPSAVVRIVGQNPPPRLTALDGLNGVEVVGAVPEMTAAIAEAWVAVAPMSVAWGMHTKVLEAMAAGVAVVATPEASSAFTAKETDGLYIRPLDKGFSEALAELLSNRSAAETVGLAARRFVTTSYAWGVADDRIEGLYRQLTSGQA